MRSVILKRNLIIIVSLSFFLPLNSAHARKILLDREGDGNTVKKDISAAIAAATQTNDTIYITGSDIDTFSGDFPSNFTNGNIVFLGANTNPDSFPVLSLSGGNWTNFWNNTNNCTTRFERVVLQNCPPISDQSNTHKCIIDKAIIRGYSSNSVFYISGNSDNFLTINNSIFINNRRSIFPKLSSHNNPAPYGTISNCTFYNNDTINADIPTNTNKLINISNSIFDVSNKVIALNNTVKSRYTYCLVPPNTTDWGTGCIQGNPSFINTTPSIASDLRFFKESDARNKGNSSLTVDISGRPRDSSPDIGAWEWADTNVAPVGITLSSTSINENNATGVFIGKFTTVDSNTSDTHTYRLVSGDTSFFSIIKDSLRAKQVFDYESDSLLVIRVRTTDPGNKYFDTTITIKINDLNEAVTGITLSNSVIAENLTIGTFIGKFSSTDMDFNDTHTYSPDSGDTAFFVIRSDTLFSRASFNYEADSLYTITVRSTDKGGLYRRQRFNIKISDVKEPPESLYISSTVVSENVPLNTPIGIFTTIDRDSGSTFTYSFVSGVNDNSSFKISGDTLRTNSLLDYESKNQYTIFVKSFDGKDSIRQTFYISITNANDKPTAISLSNTIISDSTLAGDTIGLLSTTDQDTGEIFTYSLPAYGDNAYFRIDGNRLRADSLLYFLRKPTYSIRIKVKDKLDSLTADFNISILSKPYILTEPSDVIAGEGKNATFSVVAAGSTPINYRWYNNSTPGVVIDSSSTLSVNNISMLQNNNSYYCIVSNVYGSIQSRTCSLTVYRKPVMDEDLKDTVKVVKGLPCTLSVTVNGDSLSYLWIKNNFDTLPINTSSMVIGSASAADSGNFQCVIYNISDTINSKVAFLKVLIPPIIDSFPDSVVVFDGDTSKIRISVSGTPPFSYKWVKNGTDSVGSFAELVIPDVALSDDGSYYHCMVTNEVQTISSSPIYLKVRPAPPVVDSQPLPVSITENQRALFRVKAHGTAPLLYKWVFLHDVAKTLSDSSTLVLDSVQVSSNNFKIFCLVSNVAGTISSDTVTLQVFPERPLIFNHPQDQNTNEGKRVKFIVEATGTPPLNYQWYKSGVSESLSSLDSLILDPVKKEDAGNYYCIVINSAGRDTSDTASLIVDNKLEAPKITLNPESQTRYIGDTVTFTVNATGFPLPKYQWFINNIPREGDTVNTLVIKGVSYSNNLDSVKCMVSNSEGTDYSKTAVLTITPAPVADFSANPTGGTVNVSVQFTNNSSGIFSSTIWDFGDGTTSTEPSPEHIYSKTGLYDVKLIVTGKAGSDTSVKTEFIYVYNKGENPVQISAKYLRGTEVEITLSNLDKIEPQIFPPVYDSLGIWISKVSLPENTVTASRLIKYSRAEFKNNSSFVDTLTFPEAGVTWFLMNALYLTNGKLSAFNAGNGTKVLLMDNNPPSNPLSISGRHLGGDSVLISFVASSPLDTEKVDSVLFCYAFDSLGLDYRGSNSGSFAVKEFLTGSVVEKKVFNNIFSLGSHQMWCGVRLKGKNDSLSVPKTARFITENNTFNNPIILSAQAISSSAIRLSWDEVNSDSISGIRIWYSVKQIPTGTIHSSDYSLIQLSSQQNSCIVDLLNYSTIYYFAAQVVNKKGIWSDITEKSRVSIKTLEPSDEPAVPNTITFHSPQFDSLSAKIMLSWCVDTAGIGDSLELGITYSNTGFESIISDEMQIVQVRSECDSVSLKLHKLSFNTEYFISLWLRKKGGRWALPVELSQKSIVTPNFTREPLVFFNPGVLFDTILAFNGNLILSKDSNFGSKDTFSDTAIYHPGNPHNGMVVVGNGFYFAKKAPTPAFWIGLRYNVPSGFSAAKIGLYRETPKGLAVEHNAINDTLRKIVSIYTNKTDFPFILLIDTLVPVLSFNGKIDKTAFPGKSTTDTVTITDNIINMKYQFCYSTGKDPVTIRIDSVLSNSSQQLILSIPKEFSSVETGIRAELRITDGINRIISNLSKQVYIEKLETRIFPLQWTPFSVSAELYSTSPESLLIHLSETDSSSYDGRYARIFYWLPTPANAATKDRWVEYNDQTESYFNFSPGKTFWIKTRNEKAVNLGAALTMSLKDTVKIVLPKKEFTDLTLPYNFPVRIKDIIQSSGMDSIAIYKWANDSGIFVTRGYYIPGKANRQNINDSLDWKYHNAFYSIYNMYDKEITLKIPPVPVSMSSLQPLKKQLKSDAWGVTVNCRIDSALVSEVYCGYSHKAGQIYYPASPGFAQSRVKLFDRNTNRFFGDYITGDLSGGGMAQEIAFENNQPAHVDFTFDMISEGEIPSGISSYILNTATGEWENSGKVSVGANSTEYRWIVIAGRDFMDRFKNKALSWKYGLRSVYANPVRNSAIFKFTIPIGAKERLRFSVFDAMGRRIWEKTITQPMSSGEHTLIWNGENSGRGKVSNGMYFVKLSILDSKGKVSKTFDARLVYVH